MKNNENFPSQSDVIRVAKQCGYPMDNQLHIFLVKMCELCDWDTTQVMRAVFNEDRYIYQEDGNPLTINS